MPVIDDLVPLLRDHEVGLWRKRAAWLIAIVNTVLLGAERICRPRWRTQP